VGGDTIGIYIVVDEEGPLIGPREKELVGGGDDLLPVASAIPMESSLSGSVAAAMADTGTEY
jgi:hypothetical protein